MRVNQKGGSNQIAPLQGAPTRITSAFLISYIFSSTDAIWTACSTTLVEQSTQSSRSHQIWQEQQ
jgi:hypothetical protein